MNNYLVYKHTCPNGKTYIGITKSGTYVRWKFGKGYIKQKLFYKAIQKYGWNNIKHEVIYENLSKEEACEKEIELICYYKSNQREFGYNLTSGGETGELNKEVKAKISKSLIGHKLSDGTKEKIRNTLKDKPQQHRRRKVKCIDDNLIFDSMTEAAQYYGTHVSNINKVCNNRLKTTKKKRFEYIR